MADPARRARAGGVRIGAMEAKNADLAQLRINRDPGPAASARGSRRWLAIGLPAAAIFVLAAILVITGGALRPALPVHLTPATMVSPVRAGAVLVASGYVVAQRKAAVASKGTGRLRYLRGRGRGPGPGGQGIARVRGARLEG